MRQPSGNVFIGIWLVIAVSTFAQENNGPVTDEWKEWKEDEIVHLVEKKLTKEIGNDIKDIKIMIDGLSRRVDNLASNLSTGENRLRTACIHPWHLGYNRMCVQFFKIPKSWHQARDHCRSLGDGIDLVTIMNEEENIWVDNIIPGNYYTWIGANDLDFEGQFKWSSNGNRISYSNWESGQPDGGTSENCVYITGDYKTWSDDPCTNNLCFVCQKKT